MPGKLGVERCLVVAPASHLSRRWPELRSQVGIPLKGDVRITLRSDADRRPAATMICVVGAENWRRGRLRPPRVGRPGAQSLRLLASGRSALLAVAESIVRSRAHGVSAQRALVLCVVALATTLPPAFAGATAAAIAVVAAIVVSLTLFHTLTVAALVAQTGRAVLAGPRRRAAPRAQQSPWACRPRSSCSRSPTPCRAPPRPAC